MTSFTRVTAVIFMILGALIILGGIWLAVSGFLSSAKSPTLGFTFDLSFLLFGTGSIILGATIGLQGLFLTALGQGLWLLAGVFENAQQTKKYLEYLAKLERAKISNKSSRSTS